MTPDEYAAWLADCIKANICTYHRVKNCDCYYWTGVKHANGIVDFDHCPQCGEYITDDMGHMCP